MNFLNSSFTFKEYLELIMEKEQKFDPNYYYVSHRLDKKATEQFLKLQELVNDKDVYTEPTFGRELKPHITLLYGLKEDCFNELQEFCKTIEPFKIGIGNISSFRSSDKDYDVLVSKITDESGNMNKIHNFCKKFKNDWSYNNYDPHATISYIKKETCKNVEGKSPVTMNLQVNEITYRNPDKEDTIIKLGK